MNRILLVGLVPVGLGLLAAALAIPAFAHGPEGGDEVAADQGAWEAMHEACEDGDWEAMVEAAGEVHGEDFGHMPWHGDGDPVHPDSWHGMNGHMGGGMMGGWGSMMGWR
ncbi:MAG: hypothetical protein V3S51_05100 [Dehalococcoidia bacterium]